MRGIEYDVIAAGRYKYPGFMNRREPDKYFKEEFGAILDGWFDDYTRMIAEGRNLPQKKVAEMIDTALFRADQAQQRGLVDKLAYYDEYRDRVLDRENLKRYRSDDLDLSQVNSIQDLFELVNEAPRRRGQVAQGRRPEDRRSARPGADHRCESGGGFRLAVHLPGRLLQGGR